VGCVCGLDFRKKNNNLTPQILFFFLENSVCNQKAGKQKFESGVKRKRNGRQVGLLSLHTSHLSLLLCL
jgi:hypothetical protein